MHPCSGKSPAAHINARIGAAGIIDGPAYGRVALTLIKVEVFGILAGIAAAEVYLYEVKPNIVLNVLGKNKNRK